MNKLRVFMVVPSFTVGGAENMVCQLLQALNQDTIDLTVVCISTKKNTFIEQNLADSNIRIEYLNNGGNLSLKTFTLMWSHLSRSNPDVVHTHLTGCLYVIPWILLHKRILLHTIHSTPKFEFSDRIVRLMKILYHVGKAVPVAISNKIREQASLVYDIPLSKIEVVYNPVNNRRFSGRHSKSLNGVSFINVARMNPNKNHRLLIKAYARVQKELPSASLVLVGDGESREELQEFVDSLGLAGYVSFAGNVSNVEDYLGVADVFVLTSNYEGLPLSILEAMSSSLPIISTNVGGIEDVVVDNGMLVDVGDLEGLTNAMLLLAENKELRDKMSKTSLQLSKQYDVSRIAGEYTNLYRKYRPSE